MIRDPENEPDFERSTDLTECIFESLSYVHGEEMCSDTTCLRCNDGEWEDIGERLPGGML